MLGAASTASRYAEEMAVPANPDLKPERWDQFGNLPRLLTRACLYESSQEQGAFR